MFYQLIVRIRHVPDTVFVWMEFACVKKVGKDLIVQQWTMKLYSVFRIVPDTELLISKLKRVPANLNGLVTIAQKVINNNNNFFFFGGEGG